MRLFKQLLFGLFIATMFGVVPIAVNAQDFYKDKTVRFIVGYSPGGSFDLYTRVIAPDPEPADG